MDTPENPMNAGGEANVARELAELRRAQQNLVMFVRVALIGLIVFSASVFLLLNRQVSALRIEVEKRRPVVKNAVEAMDQAQPQVLEFFRRLQAFAQANPDFAAVLAKYNVNQATAAKP